MPPSENRSPRPIAITVKGTVPKPEVLPVEGTLLRPQGSGAAGRCGQSRAWKFDNENCRLPQASPCTWPCSKCPPCITSLRLTQRWAPSLSPQSRPRHAEMKWPVSHRKQPSSTAQRQTARGDSPAVLLTCRCVTLGELFSLAESALSCVQ